MDLDGQNHSDMEQKAIDALVCAIDIRPGFVSAYAEYIHLLQYLDTP
jgi:hypothetical protein